MNGETPRSIALENSSRQIPGLVSHCREGQVANNGYNLWVYAHILEGEGGLLEPLGTSRDEVLGFLVRDLRGWIGAIRDGTRDTTSAYYDLAIIGAYFLPTDDEAPLQEGVFEHLGISVEEFEGLEHVLDVRAAREELARCRAGSVTPKFYGVRANLLKGRTTLDDIGATAEEISFFTDRYIEQDPHARGGWDSILQPQRDRASAEPLGQA